MVGAAVIRQLVGIYYCRDLSACAVMPERMQRQHAPRPQQTCFQRRSLFGPLGVSHAYQTANCWAAPLPEEHSTGPSSHSVPPEPTRPSPLCDAPVRFADALSWLRSSFASAGCRRRAGSPPAESHMWESHMHASSWPATGSCRQPCTADAQHPMVSAKCVAVLVVRVFGGTAAAARKKDTVSTRQLSSPVLDTLTANGYTSLDAAIQVGRLARSHK